MLSLLLLLAVATPVDTLPRLADTLATTAIAAPVDSFRPTPDPDAGSPRRRPGGLRPALDSIPQRPRAIAYSDWYGRRLTIHKVGSFLELPLFATQYVLGQRLVDGSSRSSVRSAHVAAATGVAVLFGVNTITGAWNLWDSRHDPAGRSRRIAHTLLMTAADAGFVWTGASAEDSDESSSAVSNHRAIAIGSMAVATAGTVMMWLWKD